jgi:anti-sigma factor ChrR (cupin superfamily)
MALAIATHLDFCRRCTLSLDSNVRWRSGKRTATSAPQDDAAMSGLPPLPHSLEDVSFGAWKGVGRGLRAAPLGGVAGLGEAVHLVTAQAGALVPHATAAEAEAIVLLQGGLETGSGAYEPGDFLRLGGAPRPPLRAGAATPCLYLIVSDDTLFPQPFRD